MISRSSHSNRRIEVLNKELRLTMEELKTLDLTEDRKKEYQAHIDELRGNIENLALSSEIDHGLLAKTIIFTVLANAIRSRIFKHPRLMEIIEELNDIGVPREVQSAERTTFVKYLKEIKCETVDYYERYHEFIRERQSKMYGTSPRRKMDLLRDDRYMMDSNSIFPMLVEFMDIDPELFVKTMKEKEGESFDSIISTYENIATYMHNYST